MCSPLTLRAYLASGSIFTAIQTVKNFAFYTDNTPADLDYMLSLNYGQRNVFSAFNDVTIDDVAKHIVKLYGDKWDALISFNSQPVNIGANNSRKITGSEHRTGNNDSTSDSTNKVSAYNSDALINDTGSAGTTVDNTELDINRSSTDETFNLSTAFNNLSIAEKTNIIAVVLKDVATYLTVSVY